MSKLTDLTINGIPEFRFSIAREMQQRRQRAIAATGSSDDLCCWMLIDTLKQRPTLERFFDRATGWLDPTVAFGELLGERISGTEITLHPQGGEPVKGPCLFRHELRFNHLETYTPKTQAELDSARVKRGARAVEKRAERERAAAPLFAEAMR